ncbi:MAG: RHS repeat-associated core domain-containing protein, partial [Anaerolineae bacterium]
KYYYAGSVRVAESSGGMLYYLLTDHLGSTALTLNSSGARQTELRYYPFGAARYNANNQVTTYRFTGQRWDSGTALYFYQSRWYDPAVGRFLAGDTIVPQPQNPQNLNRYSYVLNQPLRYRDPSGHRVCEDAECIRQVKPIIERRHPILTPQAGMIWTPVTLPNPITTYYTPTYDPAIYGADPNEWDPNGKAHRNAKIQGSMFVGTQLWKWNGRRFDAIENTLVSACSPNGVPVTLGCTQKVDISSDNINGLPVIYGTAAVAAKDHQPAYKQGTRRLYIVTTTAVLILTPLDSGGGLWGSHLDIYMGISADTNQILWYFEDVPRRGEPLFAWQEMQSP